MNALMKLAKLLQSRPSDMMIRIVRLVYALLLGATIYAGWSFAYDWSVFGYFAGYGEYCWYAVGAVALWWLLWAVSPWCLLHRRTLKRIMMGLGIFMMLASIFLIDTPVVMEGSPIPGVASSTGSVSYDSIASTSGARMSSPGVPVRLFVFLLGLISVGLGATSKFVTSGCLKYKEKITVIRV
jgi:hypothetical protein